jgi:hypothetical protein
MNPNGLTDEQIAARPEPFAGMIIFVLPEWIDAGVHSGYSQNGGWECLTKKRLNTIMCHADEVLLPGEPGCPWPPPEFRHEWKHMDKAWLLWEGTWYQCSAINDISGHYCFRWHNDKCTIDFNPATPALYIPEEE